jgi:hypothetical protein
MLETRHQHEQSTLAAILPDVLWTLFIHSPQFISDWHLDAMIGVPS